MSLMSEWRKVPSTHKLINHPLLKEWVSSQNISELILKRHVQLYLEEIRDHLKCGSEINLELEHIVEEIKQRLSNQKKHKLRAVINATGIILHTNLGRAPSPSS